MNPKLTWACQIVSGLVLGAVALLKFSGNPGDVFVFSELGMEPFGRYLIGTIEGLCALSLLSGLGAAIGALFAVGTMVGALIAHATVLGFVVNADGGMHVVMLTTVALTSGLVLVARRRELPLVGSTLG